jgi:phosphoribosylformylglycinamidine (FGAM) synthase-like amidotransferase family enzyme
MNPKGKGYPLNHVDSTTYAARVPAIYQIDSNIISLVEDDKLNLNGSPNTISGVVVSTYRMTPQV